MLAKHPGGFSSVCEWYPSVSCQCQGEIYRAVTSRQPAFVKSLQLLHGTFCPHGRRQGLGARRAGQAKGREMSGLLWDNSIDSSEAPVQASFVSLKGKKKEWKKPNPLGR